MAAPRSFTVFVNLDPSSTPHRPRLDSKIWHNLLGLLYENTSFVLHINFYLGLPASVLPSLLPAYVPELA
jgi:hypothetical protein